MCPARRGTPLIKEFVLRTFGTANWTQFCPDLISPAKAGRFESEAELSFFCPNVREDWFFDIYIQGSKKSTTLRAESEINVA